MCPMDAKQADQPPGLSPRMVAHEGHVSAIIGKSGVDLVGVRGFEPPAPASRRLRLREQYQHISSK
jgi:hypothetical protein